MARTRSGSRVRSFTASIIAAAAAAAAVVVVVVVVVLVAVPVPSAAAPDRHRAPWQATACSAFIDGVPVERHDGPDRALGIDADAEIVVAGLVPGGTDFVRVDVTLPLVRWTVVDEVVRPPARVFETVVDVGDVARVGVGVYRVEAVARGCRAVVWVEITGRSPLSTPVGITVVVVTAAGVGLLVVGLFRATAGRGGLVLAVTGGILGGLGALGVAQQFGLVGITTDVLSTWIGVPAVSSAAVHQIIARLSSRPSPPPPPSAPPPPVEAMPPATGAPPPPAESVSTPPAAPPPPSAAAPPPAEAVSPPPAAPPAARGRRAAAPPPPPPREEEQEEDPPRSAYARMDCPDAVVSGLRFDLDVGLRADPAPGVVGGPLVRPPTSVGAYVLTVQVVADGFSLAEDADGAQDAGQWRHELEVTARAPYPSVRLALVPAPQDAEVLARPIQALFSVDGQTMGMAVRSVAVVRRPELLGAAAQTPQDASTVVTVPTDVDAPDLTVRILRGRSPSDGRLLWTFETPHAVPCPDEEVATDIGDRPEGFARRLVGGTTAFRDRPGLREFLLGVGTTVADQVPGELWTVLAGVAEAVGTRAPTVLVLSEEPYVPWELAVLDAPIDPSAPPFLAAQADVGRWVLGRRRPALPPPVSVTALSMAVVSGVYHRADWRLVEAEAEAEAIRSSYGATAIRATAEEVLRCLHGQPEADILHFSLHGAYDPDAIREGLILLDGSVLDPLVVRGSALGRAPFVFLNACQVGNGNEVLGDYAGMAESFLYAGASAAVAPLWSVDDVAARELALRFYERTLGGELSLAGALRAERLAFLAGADPDASTGGGTDSTDDGTDGDGSGGGHVDGTATCLAYQFFGHPAVVFASGPAAVPAPGAGERLSGGER